MIPYIISAWYDISMMGYDVKMEYFVIKGIWYQDEVYYIRCISMIWHDSSMMWYSVLNSSCVIGVMSFWCFGVQCFSFQSFDHGQYQLSGHMPSLSLIPTCISNYIHYKVWDKITYPFPNFNSCTVEVWEWISNFIPYFLGMWLLIHAGT